MSRDKVRLYELAKEINVDSKLLIDLLNASGKKVRSHMTALDAETRQLAVDLITGKVKPQEAQTSTAVAEPPPEKSSSASAPADADSIPAPRTKRPERLPASKPAAEEKPTATPPEQPADQEPTPAEVAAKPPEAPTEPSERSKMDAVQEAAAPEAPPKASEPAEPEPPAKAKKEAEPEAPPAEPKAKEAAKAAEPEAEPEPAPQAVKEEAAPSAKPKKKGKTSAKADVPEAAKAAPEEPAAPAPPAAKEPPKPAAKADKPAETKAEKPASDTKPKKEQPATDTTKADKGEKSDKGDQGKAEKPIGDIAPPKESPKPPPMPSPTQKAPRQIPNPSTSRPGSLDSGGGSGRPKKVGGRGKPPVNAPSLRLPPSSAKPPEAPKQAQRDEGKTLKPSLTPEQAEKIRQSRQKPNDRIANLLSSIDKDLAPPPAEVYEREDRSPSRGTSSTGGRERRRGRRRGQGEDDDQGGRSGGGYGRQRRRSSRPTPTIQRSGPAILEPPITVRSFCESTGIRANQVLGKLMGMGQMLSINDSLDEELTEELAIEFGVEIEIKREIDFEDRLKSDFEQIEDDAADLVSRPPVVVFMGHVDHGKTSLMDRIRASDVVAGEAGGITQHIGAYQVETEGGSTITFLDTPGHEAFTEMRARGANATDIAVLVVAADDGIMPQTEEAIDHAKAAGVPIVVAMNKMDLPNANPDRLMQQLAQHGVQPREWGGEVEVIPTSAVTGDGIQELLEQLILEAEVRELKANPTRPGTGTCIEASMDDEFGVHATLLVRNGSLRRGDIVVCGTAFGRVRALFDDRGELVDEAGPSKPVVVFGLDEVPVAGETFYVLDDIAEARDIADERKDRQRAADRAETIGATPRGLFERLQDDKVNELAVIIKADVRGSLEAIRKELDKFDHEEVRIAVKRQGIGAVNEGDVILAAASDAIVIAFNVVADDRAETRAEQERVEVRRYDIIYRVTEDIRAALEGLLEPERQEVNLGKAVVQQTFTISRIGTVAGCRVVGGTIQRNASARVIRDGTIIGTYPLETLRRHKDDAKDVREGLECGIKLANFNDVKVGDVLEFFKTEEVKRTL